MRADAVQLWAGQSRARPLSWRCKSSCSPRSCSSGLRRTKRWRKGPSGHSSHGWSKTRLSSRRRRALPRLKASLPRWRMPRSTEDVRASSRPSRSARRTPAKFTLDIVPFGEPLVYITQQGRPRYVLFGRNSQTRQAPAGFGVGRSLPDGGGYRDGLDPGFVPGVEGSKGGDHDSRRNSAG